MIDVREIPAVQTRPLRHLVLWPHIEKEEDCNIDIDLREDAVHFAAFDGEKIVAVASLFEMSSHKIKFENQYRLRAMASHPDYRGRHAGQAIVRAAIEYVEKAGGEVLWCDARKVALGFYEKLGFERIDEWYEVPKIGPHQFMYFTIKRLFDPLL